MSSRSDKSSGKGKQKVNDLIAHPNYSGNSDLCSICLDPMVNGVDDRRTPVKLRCNHNFHLVCIGSAFNAKGFMQCPYCRNVEEGDWLYATGPPNPVARVEDQNVEEEDLVDIEERPTDFVDIEEPPTPPMDFDAEEVSPFMVLGHPSPFSMLREPMDDYVFIGPQGQRLCPYHSFFNQANVPDAFGVNENSHLTTNFGEVLNSDGSPRLSYWNGPDPAITPRHYHDHLQFNDLGSFGGSSNVNANAPPFLLGGSSEPNDMLPSYELNVISMPPPVAPSQLGDFSICDDIHSPDIEAITHPWMQALLEDEHPPVFTGSVNPPEERQVDIGDVESRLYHLHYSHSNRFNGELAPQYPVERELPRAAEPLTRQGFASNTIRADAIVFDGRSGSGDYVRDNGDYVSYNGITRIGGGSGSGRGGDGSGGSGRGGGGFGGGRRRW